MDDLGIVHTEQLAIENCFTSYYSNLWTSSNNLSVTDLVNALPNDLPCLDQNDTDFLSGPVTLTKIFRTLKSMPKGKSPGPYRLNVDFYLRYWELLKGPLFKVVSYFFLIASFLSSFI